MRKKRVLPSVLWAFTWVFYQDENEKKNLRKGGYSTAEAENRKYRLRIGTIFLTLGERALKVNC